MGFFKRIFGGRQEEDSLDFLRGAQTTGESTAKPASGGFHHVETKMIDLSDDPAARAMVIGSVESMLGQDIDGDGKVGGAAAGDDRIAELERLAKLRETGALTQEEFEAEKRRVLGS